MKINEEIVKKTIEVYGINEQARQVMEECAELIQATNKKLRGRPDNENLAEEVADVLICLNMVMQIYGITEEEVQKWIDFKQQRELARMEERKHE